MFPIQDGLLSKADFLAWLESDRLAGRNRNFVTGPGVSTYAAFARFHDENTKASEFDALPSPHCIFQSVQNGVDGNFRFDLGNAHFGGHARDDTLFDHGFRIPP